MPTWGLNLQSAIYTATVSTGTALVSEPAYAKHVGVLSAVDPAAIGTTVDGAPRSLTAGQDVTYKERITTDTTGVVFADGTTMSLGPNSDFVIDELVYNPTSVSGQISVSLARGVFRFVGGKLSKVEESPAGILQNVTREVESTLPGAPTQSLVSGQEIFLGQRITTAATGQAQIHFTDGYTTSIGPKSDTIIGGPPVTFKTPSGTTSIRV